MTTGSRAVVIGSEFGGLAAAVRLRARGYRVVVLVALDQAGGRGLYFVGAGTHPGAGVPGVLDSAKILDRLLPRVGNAPLPLLAGVR
jgi:phytoene dehydrogenase-like protein